ncbi:hypothetical protein AB0I84_02035 [Streptomyces spectabilis]|uniref:hypothetical protein n=1 Tax=Streptomyces spectabilis TaxID=68270 RepID=UPI0033C8B7C1
MSATAVSYELTGELLDEVLKLHRARMNDEYEDLNDHDDACVELVSELAEKIERQMTGAG